MTSSVFSMISPWIAGTSPCAGSSNQAKADVLLMQAVKIEVELGSQF